MGVDLVGMLDSVRQAKAINDPYSPENIMNQIAQMSPPETAGPGGFAGGISETGAIPQAQEALPPEVEGVVKGFKPKKRSFLGLLGDAILLNQGHKGPFFADRVKRKNYERAFEGMTNDPMEVVRRISTFDPETAWKMYGQLRDDQRADSAQERLMGKDQDSVLKNAAGIMGVALRNPNNRQAAIARYNQVLRSRGLEDHVLGDDVDDATLESIYYGAMPPSQQEQAEYRKIRAEQMERGLDIREKNTDSQINRRNVQNANDQVRLNQGQQRINIAKQRASAVQSVTGKSGQKYEVMDIKDSTGNVRRVVLDRKKGTAYSSGPNGSTISYIIKGNQLVSTGVEESE